GHFESDALHSGGAVTAPLDACNLHAEGATQGIGAGAVAPDAWTSQIASERRLVDLAVLLLVILVLGPGLRRRIQKIERELWLALEHGQHAALDLRPEVFLF